MIAGAAGKKILLLSVSAGAGHVRAAEAIRSHATLHHPGTTVVHRDVMDFVPSWFRRLYTDFYLHIADRYPALWGHLYATADKARPASIANRLRRSVERLSTRRLRQEIDSFQPDAIICTHFFPAELLAHMAGEGRLSCPVWVQVTDFDLHRLWVQPNIAGYFAASEEVAYRMRAYGISPQAIHTTGIPIMPVFAHAPDREECAAEFGLDPARMTVLLMGGGAGLGSLDSVAARLLALDEDFQLIALAGKNARTLAALQALAARYPGRLRPQGFTDRVERLMACADLAVTKPGGLTSSECLAMGLPMIVNSPIPGQEERNADFLLEQGAALKACNAAALEYRIRLLLRHPSRLAAMRERTKALRCPGAAGEVLNRVLRG